MLGCEVHLSCLHRPNRWTTQRRPHGTYPASTRAWPWSEPMGTSVGMLVYIAVPPPGCYPHFSGGPTSVATPSTEMLREVCKDVHLQAHIPDCGSTALRSGPSHQHRVQTALAAAKYSCSHRPQSYVNEFPLNPCFCFTPTYDIGANGARITLRLVRV